MLGKSTPTANDISAVPSYAKQARAVLVWQGSEGPEYKEVADDCSILNVERDLLDHLDSQPFSNAWLCQLRDYVDQRLAARAQAGATGGISIPCEARWTVVNLGEVA